MTIHINLDGWQIKILDSKGNIIVRTGRQIGKSTVIAILVAMEAMAKKMNIMVIAAVEREAILIFEKIHAAVYAKDKTWIKMGKDRPTKTRLRLKNGSQILCLPTGPAGVGIRGHTIDLLVADEAAFIDEAVFAAVTPSLMVTGGRMILLSTPHGKEGYFYDRWGDEDFTKFHISAEDAIRDRPISETWTIKQKEDALKHQKKQKERMTDLQYQQEYLGRFIDDLRQLFPDALIKKCQQLDGNQAPNMDKTYYLGVDVARMGEDVSAFSGLEMSDKQNIQHVYHETTSKQLTTQTTKRIIDLDKGFDFRKLNIDGRGVGAGVVDQLLDHPECKRKVEDIDNAKRVIDREGRTIGLMKEQLYLNLQRLMELGYIKLQKGDDIFHSLKSVQYENLDGGGVKIFGRDTHIAESLNRAAWGVKQKGLNPYVIF